MFKKIKFTKPPQQQLNTLLEHYQTGRFVEAENLAVSITQKFPTDQFTWKLLAVVLHQNGKINETFIANQKSVQLEPQDPEAHNNLGLTLKELGRFEEAKASYGKAIELKPDYAEAHYNLGGILRELGKLEEAEASYKKSISSKPSLVIAHYNLGLTLKELGRFEEAKASYGKAIELKPDYAEAHYNLGGILRELGKLEEAEASYKKTISLNPSLVIAHYSLGLTLKELGRFEEAKASYGKAIELKPDYAEAHTNLGGILRELGKLEEAEASYRKTISLKPDYAEAYHNLGLTLKELGRFEEAKASYGKAIELKPNYVEAYNNLGIILKELGKLEEAEASYKKTISLKPDYAKAYSNLGVLQAEIGDTLSAINSFKQAINIDPDFAMCWENIYYPLQVIKSENISIEDHLPLFNEQTRSMYSQIAKSILSYHLNQGSPSTDKFIEDVFNTLSSADNIFIKNPKLPTSELNEELTQPKKITALVHFGRSGSGLLHSLIDGHPEVSTLPSIYFSEFFDHSTWEKVIKGGWDDTIDRFIKTYEVLFDASSSEKIATVGHKFIHNIGKKEGMMNVGPERNEVLSVNKKVFIKELKRLMDCYDRLDILTFFKLVHSAYGKSLDDHKEKNLILYHIHNPSIYAQLNFLRLVPDANWLMMVREPLTSCESWIRRDFNDDNYTIISNKIVHILFQIDQFIYQNENSVGVRLEDLKEHPKKTIQALCSWLGIKEEDSLYEMTAQGKKWWGDPSGENYNKDGMDPFGKTSINRKLGYVFSENDQYILRTLFYPFSVRFGYAEENLEKFKNDLQIIRPLLDKMFDFEIKISQNKKMNTEKFMKSVPYLYLRSGMIERWNTLNNFHTYQNMLTPLKIS